jgi:hypothetical protein
MCFLDEQKGKDRQRGMPDRQQKAHGMQPAGRFCSIHHQAFPVNVHYITQQGLHNGHSQKREVILFVRAGNFI